MVLKESILDLALGQKGVFMSSQFYVSEYEKVLVDYPDMHLLEECIKKVSDYHSVMVHASGKLRSGKCDQQTMNWFLRCNNELWDNCSILHAVLVDVGVWALRSKGIFPCWDMWYELFHFCVGCRLCAKDVFAHSEDLEFLPTLDEIMQRVDKEV